MRNLNAPVEEFVKKYLDTVEMLIKKTKDALPDVKIILCEPFYLDSRTDGDPYEDIPSAKCEADFIFGNINTTDETVKNYYERLAPSARICVEIPSRTSYPSSLRLRKLHISRLLAGSQSRSFRCSSSPHEAGFAGAPCEIFQFTAFR